MKVAEKPKTTSRPCDWTPPSYAKVVRHERACAAKLSERVEEARRLQRLSMPGYKDLHR